MAGDTIELKLPLKADYLAVLRASAGVIAGGLSMTYDQVMQLRVALSEVFELALRSADCGGTAPAADDSLTVRFIVGPGTLEILVFGPDAYTGYLDQEVGRESKALLESLMDEVCYGSGDGDANVLRLVKRTPAIDAGITRIPPPAP